MSEQELNSYRLTSMEEPTDEMLSAIMKEAAEDAKTKKEIAMREFFKKINSQSQQINNKQK